VLLAHVPWRIMHLQAAGLDTWILEVQSAQASKREGESTSSELDGNDEALTGAVQDAFRSCDPEICHKADFQNRKQHQ